MPRCQQPRHHLARDGNQKRNFLLNPPPNKPALHPTPAPDKFGSCRPTPPRSGPRYLVPCTLYLFSHHKYIVRVGHFPPHVEQLQEVVELTVDVPAYRHRRSHELDVVLLNQDFLDLSKDHRAETVKTSATFVHSQGQCVTTIAPIYH